MISRSELKARGRGAMKSFFGYGLLAMLITAVVSWLVPFLVGWIGGLIMIIPVIGWIIGAALILANLILATAFGMLLRVGLKRYMVLSVKNHGSVGMGELFSCVREDRFAYVIETQVTRTIEIGLRTLVLMVCGIMKSYEYYMVPYLLAEYPDHEGMDLFKISREMMIGKKKDAFLLDLSFIGWYLLGMICCCVGVFVASLYHECTRVQLYNQLKEEYLRKPEGQEFARRIGAAAGSGSENRGRNKAEDSFTFDPASLLPADRKGYLTGTQGMYAGASIPVEPGSEVLLGSDAAQCSLVLPSPGIAPVHVKVTFDGSRFTVTDYSETGTYQVGAGRLPSRQPVTLNPGVSLRIGTGSDEFILECK